MIETLKLTPTMWSQLPDADDVAPLDERDEFVLREIREVLLKHGALNRFGVNLLHRHLIFGLAK